MDNQQRSFSYNIVTEERSETSACTQVQVYRNGGPLRNKGEDIVQSHVKA